MQFLPFFIYFSYSFYLGHLSLLGLQTKTIRRQRNSSTFCWFRSHNPETSMSSTASAFVHATRKHSKKVVRFGSPGWIPMIQAPFHSSCVALQYKTGTKFFHIRTSYYCRHTDLSGHTVRLETQLNRSYNLDLYIHTKLQSGWASHTDSRQARSLASAF